MGKKEEHIVRLGQRMDSIVAGEELTRDLLEALEAEVKRMKTIITSENPLIACFEKHVVRLLNHEVGSENAEKSEGRVEEELNVLQRAERLRDTFKHLRSAIPASITQHDTQKCAHDIASQVLREDKQAMMENLIACLRDTDEKYQAAVFESKSSRSMALGFLVGCASVCSLLLLDKFVENWGAVAAHR